MRAEIVLEGTAEYTMNLIRTADGESVYLVYALRDPLFENGGGIFAVDRVNYLPEKDWKDCEHRLDLQDIYDCDKECVAPFSGTILKTSPSTLTCPAKIVLRMDGDSVRYSISTEKTDPVERRRGTSDPMEIIVNSLPNCSVDKTNGLIGVFDISTLSEESLYNGRSSFEISRRGFKYSKFKISSGTIDDADIVAGDDSAAEDWMARLRSREWKDHYPDHEEIENKQTAWSRIVRGSKKSDESLILSGNKLLNSLRKYPEAYWRIASVYDIGIGMPAINTGFTITNNSSPERMLKEHIFTEENLRILDTLYIVDSYIYNDFPGIISQVVDDRVDICFVFSRWKYDDQWKNWLKRPEQFKKTHHHPLREEDLEQYPNMRMIFVEDPMKNREMHTRCLALHYSDDDWEYWEYNNSFDKIVDGEQGLTCIVGAINFDYRDRTHFTDEMLSIIEEDAGVHD